MKLAVPVGVTVPDPVRRRMRVAHFSGRLPAADINQLPVHQPATMLVYLATRPIDVRGRATFAEARPDLAVRSPINDLERELEQRHGTVRLRLAYLLSRVSPRDPAKSYSCSLK